MKKEERANEQQTLLEEAEQIERDLNAEEKLDIDVDVVYQNIIAELKLRGTYHEEEEEEEETLLIPEVTEIPEVQKVPEVKKVRIFPKIPKWGRWAAMFVVTLLAVFGISMTSEGNRIYMMQQVDQMLGEEVNVSIDNDDKREESTLTENEAMAEIQEKLGVQVPQLHYKPENMQYMSYMIEDELGEAYLQYEAEGQYLTLGMSNNSNDMAKSIQFEGVVVASVSTMYNQAPIEIKELKGNAEEKAAYLAQWKYKNSYYYLTGKVGQEDFISMIKKIIY